MTGIGLTIENDMINGFIFGRTGTKWRGRFFDFVEKSRVQWPERKLHKKKGDKELERMKAESTEGKKRRVCAPVGEIDQLAFHNVIISERSALVL